MLHFVPAKLLPLFAQTKVAYGNAQLKTDNLSDILNYVICKRYFTKKTEVPISSRVSRKLYGQTAHLYLNYLLEKGILVLTRKEVRRVKSRQYRLADEYWSGKIVRIENTSKFLRKKQEQRAAQRLCGGAVAGGAEMSEVKRWLIADLSYVEIDQEKATAYLQQAYERRDITHDSLVRNTLSIANINAKDYYHSEDSYGRMHTNLTVLKSQIRNQFLRLNGGEIAWCDIKNCQPLLLALYMQQNGFADYCPTEFARFKYSVLNDTFYDEFASLAGCTRNKAKPLVYKVLFGRQREDLVHHRIFFEMYPNLWEWLGDLKREAKTHKILAHELQKRESNLIFEVIVREIKQTSPHVKLFTVHDAIFYEKKDEPLVKPIFDKHVARIFD